MLFRSNSAGNGQRLYDPAKSKEEWLELGAWLNTHPTGMLLPTYRCDFFCIAIRKDAWTTLKGLDTVFGMGYFEDFDFSLRLRKAGLDQCITEDVFIYHQGSATFSLSKDMKALMKANKKIIKDRNPDVQMIHARTCNLQVLRAYGHWLQLQNDSHLDTRKTLRIRALLLDQPRSLIKKWIWKLKIRWHQILHIGTA